MIYLIHNEITNKCKIGYSVNPTQRLQELQTGSSERILLKTQIEGSYELENQIHKKFEEHRIQGEWFIYNKEIAEYFKIPYCLKPEHVFINLTNIKPFYKVTNTSKNYIILTSNRRKLINDILQISYAQLDNALRELIKNNILIKESTNIYIIDNTLFYK
jgi:hypothetical protein